MAGNSGPSKRQGEPKNNKQSLRGIGGGEGGASAPPADICDLTIDTDLEGVRATALAKVSVGDTLVVDLDTAAGFPVAVCKMADGTIVGALAAFRKLAQLISCLRNGVLYEVQVTHIGSGSCHVAGGRV